MRAGQHQAPLPAALAQRGGERDGERAVLVAQVGADAEQVRRGRQLLGARRPSRLRHELVQRVVHAQERDPQAEMADLIAARIKGWIEKREKLPGHKRPIAPGDIMILLRRRKKFADLMVRALKKAGVAVTGVSRAAGSPSA